MKFFFFLVTLFVISFYSEKAHAMNIQCEFDSSRWGDGYKEGCIVQSVTFSSSEDREITSVNGDHGKTYSHLYCFDSYSKKFNNFPQNIKKFFPNVEVIKITNANIATLTKSDMAPLGSQLRKFNFYKNNIEVLEEGLIDENPNLEFINLDDNKIKFVASGVFDKLPKLTTLYFRSNPCHDGYAVNDRAAVLNLISEIKGNCQDLEAYEKFINLHTTTTTTTEKVKTDHELRIEELTAENTELKRQQLAGDKQHQDELQKHKAEASLKDAKNKELEEQNEVLRKDLATIKPCNELHEVRDILMSKLKELEVKFEGKLDTTNKNFDTTKDMIIKTTQEKLDATLVKPMSSLYAKMDTFDLRLDSSDEKFAFLNATCLGLDYKLNLLECVRMP